MSFLKLLIFLNYPASALDTSAYVAETVAGATTAIADFFTVRCIYFIRSNWVEDEALNQRLTKAISLDPGKSVAFFNWSQYHRLLQRGDQQCHVPLRVTLQLTARKVTQEFRDFNRIYGDPSDDVRTGVWLIFLKSFEEDFVSEFFRGVYLPFDTEIIVGWISGSGVQLKEVYQAGPANPVRQPRFGSWTAERGLVSPKYPSLFLRRTDLEGIQLRVGYIDHNYPYIMREGGSLTGYYSEVWRILEKAVNVSSKFIRVEYDRSRDDKVNSFMVTINMLKERQLDVAVGNFIMSPSRFRIIDFSHPLTESRFQVFYRVSPTAVWPHIHFLPFDGTLWVGVLVWSVLHALSISWLYFLVRNRRKSVAHAFFITLGGLCGQGTPHLPKSVSCRILFFLTYLVAAVVIPSYAASLTRYLTARPPGILIKDFRDFYLAGTHRMTVVDGTFEYYFLKESYNDGYSGKIFERDIKDKKLPCTYGEALKMVCGENDAAVFTHTLTLISEWNQMGHVRLRDYCRLKRMTQRGAAIMSSIIYQKRSRVRGVLEHQLRKLRSSGVLSRLKKKYWPEYWERSKSPRLSVTLKESSALFSIFLAGALSAFALVLLEVILGRSRKGTEPRTERRRALGGVRVYRGGGRSRGPRMFLD